MTNLDNLKYVNQPIMKSDAMSLITGNLYILMTLHQKIA